MRIVHLSDTHLRGDARRLIQITRQLRARQDAGADLALAITGDVTENGELAEWVDLQAALQPVYGRMPIWIVEGNHDVGARGIHWSAERAARARLEIGTWADPTVHEARGLRVWQRGKLKVVGLDSTIGRELLARGEIGAAQLAALEVELMDQVDTVILLHHHPLWQDPLHALKDDAALLALLDRRPQVRTVLFGHQHVEAQWMRGRTLYASSRKVTDLDSEGRLAWRELDCSTWTMQRVTCPAPR